MKNDVKNENCQSIVKNITERLHWLIQLHKLRICGVTAADYQVK